MYFIQFLGAAKLKCNYNCYLASIFGTKTCKTYDRKILLQLSILNETYKTFLFLFEGGLPNAGKTEKTPYIFPAFVRRASYMSGRADAILIQICCRKCIYGKVVNTNFQKIRFQYSCLFTLFKLFEQFLQKFNILLRSRELKQTGDPQFLIISKVSSFLCHFDFASKT